MSSLDKISCIPIGSKMAALCYVKNAYLWDGVVSPARALSMTNISQASLDNKMRACSRAILASNLAW